MSPFVFLKHLQSVQLDAVFNPYRDRCPQHDRADAPRIRRTNLVALLNAFPRGEASSVWVARDLGHRGGRRTGLALTDEVHLAAAGDRHGVLLRRATKGPPAAERTAAVVWELLARIDEPVFLWNVFPLHPHEPGRPLSNRRHTGAERRALRDALPALLDMLGPRRLVAVGRDAQDAVRGLAGPSLECHAVRHPSHGGRAEFIRQIGKIYGILD